MAEYMNTEFYKPALFIKHPDSYPIHVFLDEARTFDEARAAVEGARTAVMAIGGTSGMGFIYRCERDKDQTDKRFFDVLDEFRQREEGFLWMKIRKELHID